MKRYLKKYPFLVFLFLTIVFFQSCKTDEFKFDEITIKKDFGVRIITPLFTGKDKYGNILEFRDFIHDWKKPVPDLSGPKTVIDYSNSPDITIPTQLIFDPSVIIDSLQFLIQGNYSLTDIELVFYVNNSCPFPLNLQLQFFNWSNWNSPGSPIVPPPFTEADFSKNPIMPVTTVHTIKLDSLQMQSFTNSKRIKLTSWYNQTNFINQNDTIWAHYPIDVSIVLIGTVQVLQ